MPFFVGSNLFKPPSIFLTHSFITLNQGSNSTAIIQSFNIKLLPNVANIFFLVSKSQFINDSFALKANSKAFKVKSSTSDKPGYNWTRSVIKNYKILS